MLSLTPSAKPTATVLGSSFLTMGDYGDVIYALPCLKLHPGVLYAKNGLRDHDPFIPRMPALKRLLSLQRYVEDFLPWNGEPIDFDISNFRVAGYPYGVTLAELQARSVGLLPDLSHPWLSAEPWMATKGRIVVARSPRYHNHLFPWKKLVETYGDKMLFVGTLAEYSDFCLNFGSVTYLHTFDLYEVARAIAGSELFIGNQSCPNAIAEGLKHPSVQEVCLWCPDCIYKRHNSYHCYDGELDLNLFGRTLRCDPADLRPKAHRNETPPGGWRIELNGHKVKSYAFDSVLNEIRFRLGAYAPDNLQELIIEQSSADIPPGDAPYLIRQVRSLLQ